MADVKPYPLERKWDDVLPVGPPDRHRHGTLENGVTYHVMRTHKPKDCLLYTSPSPRDKRQSRMPSSA